MGRSGRSRWWFVLAAVVLALCAPLPSAAATAGGERAPLAGEVDPGFGGRYVPGRAVPVRVTLTAEQLVEGRLGVSSTSSTSELLEFELTGGSSEEHWVLLDLNQVEGVVVAAEAVIDGREIRLDSAALRWEPDTELVGVLAGLQPVIPVGARTQLLGHEIVVRPLDPALLDLGYAALASLHAIAVTPEDLAALDPRHRAAILGWLQAGGTLYVDGPAGAVEGLPVELHPLGGRVRAGVGEVVATGGALSAGRWEETIIPSPNRSLHEDMQASANLPGPDLGQEVFALDLGRDLPSLGGLLGVLGVYILVVGPLAHVLSRRRAMLRWVAIPVVALLATGVLFVTGDGRVAGTTADVVDVIETGGGVATASSRVVLSSGSGTRTIGAPPGWTASIDESFGFDPGNVAQRRTSDGVVITVPAPPGALSFVSATGPVELSGALEVSARAAADGVVVGEVRNGTDLALTDVAVFAGRAAHVLVGDLDPGETTEFQLEGTNQFRFAPQPFREIWPPGSFSSGAGGGPGAIATTIPPPPMMPPPPPDFGPIVSETCDEFGNCEQCDGNGNCFGWSGGVQEVHCDEFGNCSEMGACAGSACDGSRARPEALAYALWSRGSSVMAPGVVTAVGWTGDLGPVLDLGGDVEVKNARTAIIGRAAAAAVGDRAVDAASIRTMVSVVNDDDLDLVFRFDLPTTVGDRPLDRSRLRIDIPEGFTRVAFVRPGGDEVVREVPFGQPAPGRSAAAVPPDAVVGGHLFVRASLPLAPPNPGREMVVYEAPA